MTGPRRWPDTLGILSLEPWPIQNYVSTAVHLLHGSQQPHARTHQLVEVRIRTQYISQRHLLRIGTVHVPNLRYSSGPLALSDPLSIVLFLLHHNLLSGFSYKASSAPPRCANQPSGAGRSPRRKYARPGVVLLVCIRHTPLRTVILRTGKDVRSSPTTGVEGQIFC